MIFLNRFLKKDKVPEETPVNLYTNEHLTPEEVEDLKQNHPEIYYSNLRGKKDWRIRYRYYVKTQPVVNNWVLYESHAGNGMLCNPKAIFKEFQKRPDFADYLHVWVISDWDEIDHLREKYKKFPNVLFIKYNSVAYAYFTARCKYLINNTSFNAFFAKRKGQVYLNTWHSITVKYIGYDIPDGKRYVKNMLRNLLMADYIVSPNKFMTGIFNESYKLKEIYGGKFIEEGYPRNDSVVNTPREEIIQDLADRGTIVDPNKKIILYAPTWNGNNVANPTIDIERYRAITSHFEKTIDTNKYQLLIKPHQIEYRNMSEDQLASCNFVSYHIDANELLSLADIVITDYSSIYFDFLVANKPILFYIPDFEEYSEKRGIYFKIEELPGPCAKSLEELSSYINDIENVEAKFKPLREETLGWACEYDNGNVSAKILNVLFDQNLQYNLKSAVKTGKKTILFYPGGLATNGVTSAFLSLLNKIDYDKYDVTVFTLTSSSVESNVNLDKIPSHIRVLLRISTPFFSPKDSKKYNTGLTKGYSLEPEELEVFERIMKREYVRIFGGAQFDYIIDFSGYGTYFPLLALMGNPNPNAKKFIWQHSDILADFTNTTKRALNKSTIDLETLVACHEKFDKIVSATEVISNINRDNLATEQTKDKYTWVTNFLNSERLNNAKNDTRFYVENEVLHIVHEKKPNGFARYTVMPLKKDCVKFATMGRYMPEKNHSNIIGALKRLIDDGVPATLYLIGDGPLRAEMESQAISLGIEQNVIFTGLLDNPFTLLKQCDCFIFPSYYEAQGLAVLEARTVGLPIIVSNFKAVSSVMIDDKQFVLNGFDADDIYEGMKVYLEGKIPTDYVFDVEEYNAKALEELKLLLEQD